VKSASREPLSVSIDEAVGVGARRAPAMRTQRDARVIELMPTIKVAVDGGGGRRRHPVSRQPTTNGGEQSRRDKGGDPAAATPPLFDPAAGI